MRAIFLGLFCLSFPGLMAEAHHPEGEPPIGVGFKIEDLKLPFVKIPAGSFIMGSPVDEKGRDADEAQVEVTISKPFEMLATEVTQRQYFEVMGEKPSFFRSKKHCEDNWDRENEICPDHPVESVSGYDAKDFIRRLNAKAGIEGCKEGPEARSGCYRLPTEAEWEWAARSEKGREKVYFFGDNPSKLGKYAVYGDNSGNRTHEVTMGWHNPNGLHGMYGNVCEWVGDIYREVLKGGEDPFNIERGLCGDCLVLRGGCWIGSAKSLRSASRLWLWSWDGEPNPPDFCVGFRLVRTL